MSFLNKIIPESVSVLGDEKKMQLFGWLGDYLGGVWGTIIGGVTLFVIVATLRSTRKIDNKSKIFAIFAEMLRTHEEIVSSIRIGDLEGREAFREVLTDFYTSYKIAKELDFEVFKETYFDGWKGDGKSLPSRPYCLHTIDQLIDLAYMFTYYGPHPATSTLVGERFSIFPRDRLWSKLNDQKKVKVLSEIQGRLRKASGAQSDEHIGWRDKISIAHKQLNQGVHPHAQAIRQILLEAARRVRPLSQDGLINDLGNLAVAPGFGGHQNRLSHYFRNLFAAFTYIEESPLSVSEKNSLAKVLRSKLSNYEQALLVINIISHQGRAWREMGLVEKYMPIKNVPRYFFSFDENFDLKKQFPLVVFEWESPAENLEKNRFQLIEFIKINLRRIKQMLKKQAEDLPTTSRI